MFSSYVIFYAVLHFLSGDTKGKKYFKTKMVKKKGRSNVFFVLILCVYANINDNH